VNQRKTGIADGLRASFLTRIANRCQPSYTKWFATQPFTTSNDGSRNRYERLLRK